MNEIGQKALKEAAIADLGAWIGKKHEFKGVDEVSIKVVIKVMVDTFERFLLAGVEVAVVYQALDQFVLKRQGVARDVVVLMDAVFDVFAARNFLGHDFHAADGVIKLLVQFR